MKHSAVREEALLVLADGEVFEGEAIGASVAVSAGEVVFNTVLSGYQEVLTDPSYAGQIITFTYPHLGNYGVTGVDDEATRPFCRGVIARDLAPRPSNWRAEADVESFLRGHGIAGIVGVDTRRLTRHLRDRGSVCGAFGTASEATLRAAAAADPGTTGIDLAAAVTCAQPYWASIGEPNRGTSTVLRSPQRPAASGRPYVVAYDFGIKSTILRHLASRCDVEVVPAGTSAADVLARSPDGVFLSNGPGDPEAVDGAAGEVAALLAADVPLFGICLGHQILALAIGASTYKLPFGHHGGNHPVGHVGSDPTAVGPLRAAASSARPRVEITSQNHNFSVHEDSLPHDVARVTYRNLNDHTVEGLEVLDSRAFSVQYHPEAGPGPHDAAYLFDTFLATLRPSGARQ